MKIKITIRFVIDPIGNKESSFRRITKIIASIFGMPSDLITVEEDTDG